MATYNHYGHSIVVAWRAPPQIFDLWICSAPLLRRRGRRRAGDAGGSEATAALGHSAEGEGHSHARSPSFLHLQSHQQVSVCCTPPLSCPSLSSFHRPRANKSQILSPHPFYLCSCLFVCLFVSDSGLHAIRSSTTTSSPTSSSSSSC